MFVVQCLLVKVNLGPHPVRNIAIFFLGVAVSAIGVTIAVNSILGVSPSSSIPTVVSTAEIITMGVAMTLLQMFFFVSGFLIMGRKNYKPIFLLAIPVLILYSVTCGLVTDIIAPFIYPDTYLDEWIVVIIGTLLNSVGISLQLASNLSMVPLDMFANLMSVRFKMDYSTFKISIDVLLVIFAVLLSFLLLGSLVGVREGTIFAALFTGAFTRFITKFMRKKGFYEWVGHREFSYESKKKKTSES